MRRLLFLGSSCIYPKLAKITGSTALMPSAEAIARSLTCWGSGTPLREFLHVEDMGEACVFALKHWRGSDDP